jgi:predicted DNA-binding transcriptional regulator AlpA
MVNNVVLCTRREAADLLGLAPQTLAKWAMTGKNLPVVRLGKRTVRYSRIEIEAFIKRSTVTSGGIHSNHNYKGVSYE